MTETDWRRVEDETVAIERAARTVRQRAEEHRAEAPQSTRYNPGEPLPIVTTVRESPMAPHTKALVLDALEKLRHRTAALAAYVETGR